MQETKFTDPDTGEIEKLEEVFSTPTEHGTVEAMDARLRELEAKGHTLVRRENMTSRQFRRALEKAERKAAKP